MRGAGRLGVYKRGGGEFQGGISLSVELEGGGGDFRSHFTAKDFFPPPCVKGGVGVEEMVIRSGNERGRRRRVPPPVAR